MAFDPVKAAALTTMKGWTPDADGGLWTVEWRGLRFVVEIQEHGWRASCRFVNGAPEGMEEAAGGLSVWPDRNAARLACRRHAADAAAGRYRRRER